MNEIIMLPMYQYKDWASDGYAIVKLRDIKPDLEDVDCENLKLNIKIGTIVENQCKNGTRINGSFYLCVKTLNKDEGCPLHPSNNCYLWQGWGEMQCPKYLHVQTKYVNFFKRKYPKAVFYLSKFNDNALSSYHCPIYVRNNNQLVGCFMPIACDWMQTK